MAQWYYTKNGQQAGPVDQAELGRLVSSGQVTASDLVWKDGMANWVPASSVPELSGAGAPQYGSGGPQYGSGAPQYGTGAPQYGVGGPAPGPAPQQFGGYAQPQYAAGSVPTYLVQSILTLFCCMPLGVVAVVFAAQVNSKLTMGDYAGAVDASKKAKMFSVIALVLGLLVYGGYFLVVLILAGAHS